jgi:hypothetical protein
MRWARYVARTGKNRNAYRLFEEKTKGMSLMGITLKWILKCVQI